MDGYLTKDMKLAKDGVHTARRHDSAEKQVAGRAAYADDLPEPKALLHVHIVGADIACGTVAPLDLSDIRKAPGVIWIGTADDIPGENNTGPVIHDEEMLAGSETRPGQIHFHGQPLFLVAAETVQQARTAAKSVKLVYTKETPLLTIDDAIAATSLLGEPYRMARGNIDTALATAPHRVQGQIEIGGQEQFYLEGQIAIATPGEDGDMHVISSNQHPSECQLLVAHMLGVPGHAVTIEVRRIGGGFGGKETQGNLMACSAALVARHTGRPAKCRLDRDQDMILTGKRHEARITYDAGVDGDGRIMGLRVRQDIRCGWSTDLSHAIADRAMFHADNCYYLPAAEITSYRLRTNTCSNTAFRGFGGPQGMLGAERVIDHIAHQIGRDPLEVRRINFYEPPDGTGDRAVTPYHMTVEDCVIEEIVDELVETSDYTARRAAIADWNADNPILKKGIALTPVRFGISFTTTHLNQAGALVHLYQDGSVMLNHGGIEMGQGLFVKVAQVAASAFNIDLDRVKITSTRTDKVPNTSATAASSGSDMNGMAVDNACAEIRGRLIRFLCENHNVTEAQVEFLPNRVRFGAQEMSFNELAKAAYLARVPLSATGFYATPKISWDRAKGRGRPFFYFAYGAAVSEVVIDTLTGENRLTRVDILHDVGKSLNPAIDFGQIEGGFVQGAGWLTMEELWWDDAGRLRTHAPSTYKIPTASDRPPVMNIRLWEKGMNRELTIKRSKAVGEPPLMLANSVHQAISHAISFCGDAYPDLDAPATPEQILGAITRLRA